MDVEQYRKTIIDEEQLRLLSIFYWVNGGVTALVSLYFLIYVAIGAAIAMTPVTSSTADSPEAVGWVFAGVGVAGFVVVAVMAALQVSTGFWLQKRTHRVAAMVVAGVTCLGIPFGTMLGVLTFLALGRPSASALFADVQVVGAYPSAPPPPPFAE